MICQNCFENSEDCICEIIKKLSTKKTSSLGENFRRATPKSKQDDAPHSGIMFDGIAYVVSAWDCENTATWYRLGTKMGPLPSTIRDLMLAGF